MANIVVVRYRYRLACFSTLYVVFLVIPWAITCFLASRETTTFDPQVATNFCYALEVLGALSALIALPVIYAIIARAAVVYSLRTRQAKKLNARQLFALADRKFVEGSFTRGLRSGFFLAATGLILIALIQPLVRLVTVQTRWDRVAVTRQVARTDPEDWRPRPVGWSPSLRNIQELSDLNVVQRVRQELVGLHPVDWQRTAWYDTENRRYFATSLPKDTVTGAYRMTARRLDSRYGCTDGATYPSPCPGHEFPFKGDGVNISICVFGPGILDPTVKTETVHRYGTPWSGPPTAREDFRGEGLLSIEEGIYVQIDRDSTTWMASYCYAQTNLSTFELGNIYNGEKFGGPIRNISVYKDASPGIYPYVGRSGWVPAHLDSGSSIPFIGSDPTYAGLNDRPDRRDWSERHTAPGPLMIAALALFGNGSFYNLVQAANISFRQPQDPHSGALAASCAVPFQRLSESFWDCTRGSLAGSRHWTTRAVSQFVRNTYVSRGGNGESQSSKEPLTMALYLANRAVLEESVVGSPLSENSDAIYYASGAEYRRFVIPRTAIYLNSALLGIQVLAIVGLLLYAYSVPTWSETLDAMAVARIAHQLKDDNFLKGYGLRELNRGERRRLERVDGLIGVEEPPAALEDMVTPTSADSRRSGPPPIAQTAAAADAAAPAPALDNSEMGMGSIPVDVQTIMSEDIGGGGGGGENGNDDVTPTTHANDNNNNHNNTQTAHDPPVPTPRISAPDQEIRIDTGLSHDQEDGRNSPPAYTPRRTTQNGGRQGGGASGGASGGGEAEHLEPPSYATALAVNPLRVGAPGLVTWRLPYMMKEYWV